MQGFAAKKTGQGREHRDRPAIYPAGLRSSPGGGVLLSCPTVPIPVWGLFVLPLQQPETSLPG